MSVTRLATNSAIDSDLLWSLALLASTSLIKWLLLSLRESLRLPFLQWAFAPENKLTLKLILLIDWSYYHLKQLFVFHFYSAGLYCDNLCYCVISSLICYCGRCCIISFLVISFGVVFVIFLVFQFCCSTRVLL